MQPTYSCYHTRSGGMEEDSLNTVKQRTPPKERPLSLDPAYETFS